MRARTAVLALALGLLAAVVPAASVSAAAAPEWCRACMDLECYVYVPYPCTDRPNGKPQWCKACMDLECGVYLPYPCLRDP